MIQAKVSSDFKKKAIISVIIIILFIVAYIGLILSTFALMLMSIYVGFGIITLGISLATILLGSGVMIFGVMIFIFIIKFIFTNKTTDNSQWLEIDENDEPEIFNLIEDIVKESGTPFPAHVYLSADVNAFVFYDSNFLSLFFPTKKNLNIGIGLINSVTVSELKAILSHEFGHFSQNSMKIGSYVYNLNKIIYNVLYENDGYAELANKISSFHGFFAFIVRVSIWIINGIQWILSKIYGLLNVNYMALSREMEFHADEFSAHICGAQPLKTSLLRIELSSFALQSAISFYVNRINEGKATKNIYPQHLSIMEFIARTQKMDKVSHFPDVKLSNINQYNRSKLIIKDQWASHPEIDERIKALDALQLPETNNNFNPANSLIKDLERYQLRFTKFFFNEIEYNKEIQYIDKQAFEAEFSLEQDDLSLDKYFNGLYNFIDIDNFDLKDAASISTEISSEDFVSSNTLEKAYSWIAIVNDLQTIDLIRKKQFNIKTFDYNGFKYKAKESDALYSQLEKEKNALQDDLVSFQKELYQKEYHKAEKSGKSNDLKEAYEQFFIAKKSFEQQDKLAQEIFEFSQFFSEVLDFDIIQRKIVTLSEKEKHLKNDLKELLENELIKKDITEEMKNNTENYISNNTPYFENNGYNEHLVKIFFEAIHQYIFLVHRRYFREKKKLLALRTEILNES